MSKIKYLILLLSYSFLFGQGGITVNRTWYWDQQGAAPAACGDLLAEDFEGGSTGDDLCTLTGWVGACSDNRELSDTYANGGSLSGVLKGQTAGYGVNKHGLGGQSSGDFLISFYIYVDVIRNGHTAYFIAVPDSNNSNHAQMQGRVTGSGSTWILQYVNSGGGASTVESGLAKGQWYFIEILMDMDGDDQSWKVDNVARVTGAAFAYNNSGESATHIELDSHDTNNDSRVYIDDLCANTDTSSY